MNVNDAADKYHCNGTTTEKLFRKICRICWMVSVAGSPEVNAAQCWRRRFKIQGKITVYIAEENAEQ